MSSNFWWIPVKSKIIWFYTLYEGYKLTPRFGWMSLSNESVGVLPILWVGGGLQDFSVSSLILEWYDIWFLSGNGASGKHYQSLMKTAGKSTTMLSSHLMSNHSSINDVSLSPLGTNLGFELGWTGLGLGLEWRFGRLRVCGQGLTIFMLIIPSPVFAFWKTRNYEPRRRRQV